MEKSISFFSSSCFSPRTPYEEAYSNEAHKTSFTLVCKDN